MAEPVTNAPSVRDLLNELERSLVEARAARDRKVAADDEKEADRERTY